MKLYVNELTKILEIASILDVKEVTIDTDSSSGIGTTVNASYHVVVDGIRGDLTVKITGPESW